MVIEYTAKKESSWEQLKKAVRDGTIREQLPSGSRIPVVLKTDEKVTFVAAYDDKGKLYFVMDECMKEYGKISYSGTNEGGWAATELRVTANGKILESFPDDLRDVIVPTKIVQVIDDEKIECFDNLFCLSHTQIFGHKFGWEREFRYTEPEDTQLDIFEGSISKKAKRHNSRFAGWWTRTPCDRHLNSFMSVEPDGCSSRYSIRCMIGIVLAFCIYDPDNPD